VISDWWRRVLELVEQGFTLSEASDMSALKEKHARYEYSLRASRSTTPWRDEVERAVSSLEPLTTDQYDGLRVEVYHQTHRHSLCGHQYDQRLINGYYYRRCLVNGMVWRLEVKWITDDAQGSYPVPPYRVVEWAKLGKMDEPLSRYE
jgi:hypothetical protein